ncbi:MAG: hypothetical protein ACTSVT_07975, partial [Candidatus Thorarchaeota archaeon]
MKARTIFYSIYLVLSLLVSITVAAFPSIILFIVFFENIDSVVDTYFAPLSVVKQLFLQLLGPLVPSFA